MGIRDRVSHAAKRLRWDGTTGAPRSRNGASSLHLVWDTLDHPWVAAEATIEVTEPPSVAKLYFWALQVSFVGPGRPGGGAHLGLQWHPDHPGSAAVNWGGYAPGGRNELTGSASALPSATGNPNTRDYPWKPRHRYRLRIEHAGEGRQGLADAWRGSVTDLDRSETTVVRDLFANGNRLQALMVWSEVFADCDDPPVSVRWSEFAVITDQGRRFDVREVRTNYQSVTEGGCTTTDSVVDGDGFLQRTNTPRTSKPGLRLTAG